MKTGPPVLLGHSEEARQLRGLLDRVAPLETVVLVIGEAGAGKGQVAEAIHQMSPRSCKRLQRVNCSAGSEEQIEREIFGFNSREEGWKEGRLELAHEGVLLLEEVEALTPKLQHRLVRAMRERGLERTAGAKRDFVALDVRYLLTTCLRLEEAVKEGRVRADFYRQVHRLPVEVAPLRARKVDLPLLAGEWLSNFGRSMGFTPKGMTPGALEALVKHSWPGNLQEFEGALERAVVLAGIENVVDAAAFDFLRNAPGLKPAVLQHAAAPAPDSALLKPLLSLEEMEKRHILRALEFTNQNRTRAAGLLKISVRTLRNKLHLYRLQEEQARSSCPLTVVLPPEHAIAKRGGDRSPF